MRPIPDRLTPLECWPVHMTRQDKANHNGCASTTPLATRDEVAHQLQESCTQLCVPHHNLERYDRRSFSCAGPVLWNLLPEDMRLADSLNLAEIEGLSPIELEW